MAERSPAQVYALVFGVVLLAGGILGFFYDNGTSFAVGNELKGSAVLGILEVNAWHNIVHVASGLVGLAVAGSYAGARTYALLFGLVYAVVAFLGFVNVVGDPNTIVSLLPVNTEDNILHLLIALAGLGAYAATPASPAPTTTTAPAV